MSVPVRDLIKMAENQMAAAGCAEAKLDAELLYRYLFGLDKVGFFKEWSRILDDNSCERYFELVERRASGVPLQYITGEQEFMGFSFAVDESVLIPRQDTEVLVENVLEKIEDPAGPFAGKHDVKILDLCCGSGAIGISLALLCDKAKVMCTDISEAAAETAEKNAKALGAEKRVGFAVGDLFEPFDKKLGKTKFDIIVSNPPYIKSEIIPTLQREVKDHEPLIALDGGADGLDFYRRIVEEAPNYLKKGGVLFMEIDCSQAEDIAGLVRGEIAEDSAVSAKNSAVSAGDEELEAFEGAEEADEAAVKEKKPSRAERSAAKKEERRKKKEKHFTDIEVVKDLAGRDRVVVLKGEGA